MRRIKRNTSTYVLIILLLGITLGYAYLNTTLNINGTTNITSANWSIYWDNIQLGSNNVTDITTPATISSGLTEVTFNVNFKEPGDTYEFTVDAVNDGSIDAMVDVLTSGVYAVNGTTPKTLPAYLEYTVTYSDGIEVAPNHLLASGATETYKVRVHYKEDITASQLPSTNDNYMFKFSVTYVQATDSAVAPRTVSFADDSWKTIVGAIKVGNTSTYQVGDTKTVDMGTFGTHTLRIANTTTPDECSTEGFSQTACGFVLEFADIITTHRMNSTSTNVGGWPASEMRTYVNSDIYNALPEILKNAIINTTVVSGHGTNSGETNFTSTDKLFLLAPFEIYGVSGYHDNYDTTNMDTLTNTQTRQLDYYNYLGVTPFDNYSGAIKQFNGSNSDWWMRSASALNDIYFGSVAGTGYWRSYYANHTRGVSPAFRIG